MANATCCLEMEGASVHWVFTPARRARETLVGVAEIAVHVTGAQSRVRSVEFVITLGDLEHLASYFERHVEALGVDANHSSHVLIDQGMGYRVAAGESFVPGHSDQFTVRVLLNVGTADSGSRVWLGVECQMSPAAALRFAAQVREVVASVRGLDA